MALLGEYDSLSNSDQFSGTKHEEENDFVFSVCMIAMHWQKDDHASRKILKTMESGKVISNAYFSHD